MLLAERFSSIQRLLRTVAIILRWLQRRRHFRQAVIGAREMDDALEVLIRLDQQTHFMVEIKQLEAGSDKNHILRVGGRIENAELGHDQRFPLILPKSTPLVKLLIKQAQETTLHGGAQLMLHSLRRKFWIPHASQAVKSFVHKCVVCRLHRGLMFKQQMAPLPGQRVKPARPFVSSGVDYCGPFTLRIGTKRSRTLVKTYLAIFICMLLKPSI
ncbi:PREDICTED: uncharacterized protein LOC108374106 [Rhagoletis zephyria]|uniref:uncharacterized protein LOC108374106 n=1 Tax=Rhagoletis zephyria TaxID=28612 RepID=UPI0008113ABA|nr:PREDICTED: uncharacterized protein LOC108374106 [Rhagoletis zephyria]